MTQFTHQEKSIIGNLQLIEKEDIKVSNISYTTDGTADRTSSPVELPSMPPASSFQPEQNITKHWIALQDAQIPQEAFNLNGYNLAAWLSNMLHSIFWN